MEIFEEVLENIKGIGPRTAKMFGESGIKNVADLIGHYPYRYEDYSVIKKIKDIKYGEAVTIKAKVLSIQSRRAFRNRRLSLTEAILSDSTGNISALWFNQPYLATTLNKGEEYFFSGLISAGGKRQIQNPVFDSPEGDLTSVGRLVPIYSLPDNIAPKRYRAIIHELLKNLPDEYDILPDKMVKELGLLGRKEALLQIHFPVNHQKLKSAKDRLAFDELLVMQIEILKKRELLKKSKAPKIPFIQHKIKEFVDSLPFPLTLSQKKSAWEIIQDLENNSPMNRLLQGDVGSGKTVVAAIAIFSVTLENWQSAVLAPTEILAQQHYSTLTKLLEPKGIKTVLLTASTKGKESIYHAITEGEIDCVIGTHAILTEKFSFKKLGLLVVDEQHRFGVRQRSVLRQAQGGKKAPHLLSMTATPIPRTLALTLYGDLGLSSITEMPPGRAEIKTQIIAYNERNKAYALVRKEILAGRQCFVICPLIEESDILGVKSAIAERDRLAKEVFPNFSIGLIHGRLNGDEKEKIMRAFKEGEYHILVSTSVVEVGIDVPNATIILVEGAERFGLAQLHQFRGRVGRGQHQSHCILIPSSNSIPERLKAICKYNDGFKLAELDLKYRGMGQLTGVEQSGFLELKIADPTNLELVKKARNWAEKIIKQGLENYQALKMEVRNDLSHPE